MGYVYRMKRTIDDETDMVQQTWCLEKMGQHPPTDIIEIEHDDLKLTTRLGHRLFLIPSARDEDGPHIMDEMMETYHTCIINRENEHPTLAIFYVNPWKGTTMYVAPNMYTDFLLM